MAFSTTKVTIGHTTKKSDMDRLTDNDIYLNLLIPIGTILAWHKSMTGVPALSSNFHECDGSVISDADSPMDGETLPDLNGDARFLRGSGTSGTEQAASMLNHKHDTVMGSHHHTYAETSAGAGAGGYYGHTEAFSRTLDTSDTDLGTKESGDPKAGGGTETKPINMSVVWIMRIK